MKTKTIILLIIVLILIASCSVNSRQNVTEEAAVIINEDKNKVNSEEIALFLPPVVEKSFFENKILAAVTDAADYFKIRNNYGLRFTSATGLKVPVYMLDKDIDSGDKNILLEYYRTYTGLTGNDIIQMYIDYDIPYDMSNISAPFVPVIKEEEPDPDDRYAHVRFGETRELLLLEIEWHTVDTWLDYVEEQKSWWLEAQTNDWFTQLSASERRRISRSQDNYYRELENQANDLSRGRFYSVRALNGRTGFNINISLTDGENISDKLSDGYYIYEIYPYSPYIIYADANGEQQYKNFEAVYSKREYDNRAKNEIIPFCDDLWAKGLMTQEEYNYHTTFDPLDYYVNWFFNN